MRIESLKQLTLARFREFTREPEAVFWTFVFPLLLAGGLAIAFRDKAPEQAIIATVTAPAGDSAAASIGVALNAAASAKAARIKTREIPSDSINDVLRTGTAALIVVPNAGGGVEYRFDSARPEARAARQITDELLQRARGRRDVMPVREVTVRERGSRYIDFFVPGLLAMNIMGSSIWSLAVIQPIVQALPLTAPVNGLRAVMLQGVGISGVLPELAVLAAYLLVRLTIALRIFRWQ